MQNTLCTLCYSNDYTVIFPGNSSAINLLPEHVAARKGNINKVFSYNWVRCNKCGLVYANPIPDENILSAIYVASDQGCYSDETVNLSYTYEKYLIAHSGAIENRGIALDVGAGTGFFLRSLKNFGFFTVVGIEPSATTYASAAPDIKPYLRNTMFIENDLTPESFDLISCFQTLEHVISPDQLLAGFSRLLAPKGIIYSVAHNFGSLGVKLLGARHPIVNAGHLTLFDMETIRKMFEKFFDVVDVFPISNRYSLAYWLTLFPFPDKIRKAFLACSRALRIDCLPLTMSLGNMGIIARKR